jgi:hypothetical protein
MQVTSLYALCVLGVWILPRSTIFRLDFRTVLTVWYFLFFSRFWNCVIFCFSRFWKCSDSVLIFVFLDFGTVLTVVFFVFLDFRTVLTVWYFLFFLDFGTVIFCFSRFWNCSDSVLFFVFLDFGTVLTVCYFLFF